MTVTAPNTQTVGQPLTLTCNVTTVRGITSQIDMVWSKEDKTLKTLNNISPTIMDSSVVHSDSYTITALTVDDDDKGYECILTIKSVPIVRNSDTVILDLPGMSAFVSKCCSLCFSTS